MLTGLKLKILLPQLLSATYVMTVFKIVMNSQIPFPYSNKLIKRGSALGPCAEGMNNSMGLTLLVEWIFRWLLFPKDAGGGSPW